jgi:acylphosphatase
MHPVGRRPEPGDLLNETEHSAADITVEGVVQGVGFRDFARRQAQGLGLSGFASNLRDGRVRVRAEGSRTAIETLARALEQGPRLARVSRIALEWCEPSGRWVSFIVRDETPTG